MARLEDVLLESETSALLVAHSLGCQLVAAWAAHSRHTARVVGALLVAPPDIERDDMPPNLAPWRPIVRRRLPFASVAVTSSDDPYCGPERAQAMARDWGARQASIGPRGHINGESGLGDWPAGRALLDTLRP
jgi:predicted alpha/beta hydrolase family esterase